MNNASFPKSASPMNANSFFAHAEPVKEPEKVEIPKAFFCPITYEVMEEPYLCIIDGYTYERSAITKALKQYGRSPMTNEPIPPDQSIENILKLNRTLKDAIEEFCEKNPQLFQGNRNQI